MRAPLRADPCAAACGRRPGQTKDKLPHARAPLRRPEPLPMVSMAPSEDQLNPEPRGLRTQYATRACLANPGLQNERNEYR